MMKRVPVMQQESDPTNDEAYIENVETSGLKLKDDVHFRIKVGHVGETVDMFLLIWDPMAKAQDNYPIEKVIDLVNVYPEHWKQVQAYLVKTVGVDLEMEESEFDAALFAPGAVALVLMERCKLLIENGGSEMNIYVKIGDAFDDMVPVERDIAKLYAVMAKK